MITRWPLALAATVLGGVTYLSWPPPLLKEAEQDKTGPGAKAEVKTPFLVQVKVREILDQQRRLVLARSPGEIKPAEMRIRNAVYDIKERLLRDGIHSEAEMVRMVRLAAKQAGLNSQQTEAVVDGFLAKGVGPAKADGALPATLKNAVPAVLGSKD